MRKLVFLSCALVLLAGCSVDTGVHKNGDDVSYELDIDTDVIDVDIDFNIDLENLSDSDIDCSIRLDDSFDNFDLELDNAVTLKESV